MVRFTQHTGSWSPVTSKSEGQTIELSIAHKPPKTAAFSLVLSAGIGFGTIRSTGPEQVRWAGSGRILKLA